MANLTRAMRGSPGAEGRAGRLRVVTASPEDREDQGESRRRLDRPIDSIPRPRLLPCRGRTIDYVEARRRSGAFPDHRGPAGDQDCLVRG